MYKLKITTFVILLIFAFPVFSQEKEFVWSPIPNEEVPDSLDHFDAVFFEKWLEIENGINATSLTNYARVAVLNDNAVQKLKNQMLLEFQNTNIVVFDARIHKPSGRIIDYNKESTEVDKFRGDAKQSQKDLQLVIHDLEVGDILELAKRVDFNYYMLSNNVMFHDRYPVLKSRFSLIIGQNERLEFKRYNSGIDFIEPVEGKTAIKYEFNFGYITGLQFENENLIIPTREIPYLKYLILNKQHAVWDWNNGYTDFLDYYKNREEHDLWTHEYFEEKFKKDSGSVDDKIKRFHEYVNNNYQYVKHNSESDIIKLKDFIKEEKIDEINIYPLYRKVLRVLKKPFYVVFAESKYRGDLEKDVYFGTDETDVFFAFQEDNSDNWVYLYPKSSKGVFLVNELPVEVLGTKAIFVNEKEIKELRLPDPSDPNNRMSVTNNVVVNNNRGVIVKADYKFYGAKSTNVKNVRDNEIIENELLVPNAITTSQLSDKKYSLNYPFYYSFKMTGGLKKKMVRRGDSCFLSLNNLITHNIIKSPHANAKMTMYPSSGFEDKRVYFISFSDSSEIKLVNTYNVKFHSKVGYFTVSFKQVKPNLIKVVSKYSILKTVIKPEDFEELRKLNNTYLKAKSLDLKWVLKN